MTKKRTILAILLGAIMALCLSLAVACGGEDAAQGTIKWTINDKEHVTVTVDGKTELPETYTVGETLEFKVTPAQGYEVTVKNGRATLNEKNGVYSFQVKETNEIAINATKQISGVSVTTKPTKMTYYAGEQLDPAGMVVTISYATGESETKTDGYTVNYPTENATAFVLGDNSFTVTYGGITSAAVALDQTVVGKVVIDPQLGKIADAYKTALEQNTEIKNIQTDAKTGAISFEFEKALVTDITLPLANQMTRGEGEAAEDFQFVAWNNGSAAALVVPAELAVSMTYKAVWNAHLLELTKVYYNLDTTGTEKVPQLIVEGTYRAAKSAYLYLYEGKDMVELVGPSIGGENTKRGDKFTLTFDMREVVKKGYTGKWMDIKFRAETDGIVDTQEINLADYEGVEGFYTKGNQINADGYRYYFEEYTENGVTTLKAVAAEYVSMEYTIAIEGNGTDNLAFKFTGTVKEEIFYGKTAVIDFYVGSTKAYYGVIGANGTFEITVTTSDWPLTTSAYAHFSVIESQQNATKLFPKSGEYNLVNNDCKNDNFSTEAGEKAPDGGNGNLLASGTLMMHNADYTRTFYIGPGKWGGIIAYGYNEFASLEVADDIALKVDSMTAPTKVYYVVTVKVSGRTGYTEDQLKTIVFGNTDGSAVVYHQDNAKFEAVEGQEKTYKLWFDVTAHAGKSMLWSNLYFEVAATQEGGAPSYNKILEIKDSDCSTNGLYAVVNGTKYTILCTTKEDKSAQGEFTNNTYNSSNLICTTAAETDTNPEYVDPEYVPPVKSFTVDMSTLKLELVGGKPTLTIGGDVSGYAKEDITFDLQTNGVFHRNGGWQYVYPATTVTIADGKFTVTVDLSGVGLHETANANGLSQYLMHLKFGTTNFDIEYHPESSSEREDDANKFHVEYNELHYSIIVRKSQTWDRDVAQLAISEEALLAPDLTPTYSATNVELQKTADKVYYVVSGTSKNYSDEDLRTALQGIRLTLQHNHNFNNQGWTYVTPESQEITVTSGAWTIKVDVTSVAAGSYTSKFTTAGVGDDVVDGNCTNLTVATATECAQELDGKKYITVNAAGSGVPKQFWGAIGFEVIESTDVNVMTIRSDLELDNDKVYFVLTVRAPSFTAETIKNSKMGDGVDSAIACAKVVASSNGVYFKLYYDVTNLETSPLWTHLYINDIGYEGSDNQNGNIYADPVNKSVTFNGKKYELQAHDGTYWITQVLVSTVSE